MSLTGTRSPDDRRRRRLAVAGDLADVADLDAGGVGVLRERIGDLPSASPWLPRQLWKRNALYGIFWIFVVGTGFVLMKPFPPHPQIAPAVEHLTQGARPILRIYMDVVLWMLAGQFAAIVGWYRSHSQLDFQGRYRVWAWAAVVLTAWGFFAGTSLHTAVAAVAGPQLRWPIWRAEIVVWLVPAVLAGLSVWWLADRDMQRNAMSVWLVRTSLGILLACGLGELFTHEMSAVTWFPAAMMMCQLAGVGLLITGLWQQAWYVAYVSADPPEAREPINWRGHAGTLLGWFSVFGYLAYLWPFRRREAADAARTKRRTTKKKEDEEETEAEATPKRRRKPATKTKRATKPRTRVKPEPEPEYEEGSNDSGYEDEAAAEEAWEEVDDSSAETEEEWTEEYEEEEPPAPPVRTPARSTASAHSAPQTSKPSVPPTPAKPAASNRPQPVASDDSDDEDADDDDANYRVDGGSSGSDMFKGLSKRQRRELRKQMKDKERQQRG